MIDFVGYRRISLCDVPQRATGRAPPRRVAGDGPALDGERVPPLHADGGRAPTHRRNDIDDLARAIGNSNHLAAQLARERELDVLVDTSIALASRLDTTELLAEIARRMTSLLDCHFCAISGLDAGPTSSTSSPTMTTRDSASPTPPPTS